MRRFLGLAATTAAAVMLATAVPSSSQAANGQLDMNGVIVANPSGCYTFAGGEVVNATDEDVRVHRHASCGGPVEGPIPPGETSLVADAQGATLSLHIY